MIISARVGKVVAPCIALSIFCACLYIAPAQSGVQTPGRKVAALVIIPLSMLATALYFSMDSTNSGSDHKLGLSKLSPLPEHPSIEAVDSQFCSSRFEAKSKELEVCESYIGRKVQVVDDSGQFKNTPSNTLLVFDGDPKESGEIELRLSSPLSIKSGQSLLPGKSGQFIRILPNKDFKPRRGKKFSVLNVSDNNLRIAISRVRIDGRDFEKYVQPTKIKSGKFLISTYLNRSELDLSWLHLSGVEGLAGVVGIAYSNGTVNLNSSYIEGQGAYNGILIGYAMEKSSINIRQNVILADWISNRAVYIGDGGRVSIEKNYLAFSREGNGVKEHKDMLGLYNSFDVSVISNVFAAGVTPVTSSHKIVTTKYSEIITGRINYAAQKTARLDFRNNIDMTGISVPVDVQRPYMEGVWLDNKKSGESFEIPSARDFFERLLTKNEDNQIPMSQLPEPHYSYMDAVQWSPEYQHSEGLLFFHEAISEGKPGVEWP